MKEKECCESSAKDVAEIGLSSNGQQVAPPINGQRSALKNFADSATSDTLVDQSACGQPSAIASHHQATTGAVAPISVEVSCETKYSNVLFVCLFVLFSLEFMICFSMIVLVN